MKNYTKYKIIITKNDYIRNLETSTKDSNNIFLEEIEYIDKSIEKNELNFM